jgi:hypothetical protein
MGIPVVDVKCTFMLLGSLLLPVDETIYFVLIVALFACCVNVQIKYVIIATSTYDKYVEHRGSFITLTTRIVAWPAATGQNMKVTEMDLKCICCAYEADTLLCCLPLTFSRN